MGLQMDFFLLLLILLQTSNLRGELHCIPWVLLCVCTLVQGSNKQNMTTDLLYFGCFIDAHRMLREV